MLTAMVRTWRAALRLPFHPMLVAAFPVLFLFAQNAAQQVTLAPLWMPLLASLGMGLAAWLLWWGLLRDRYRGALLASWLLALFFSFGHAWNLIGGLFPDRVVMAGLWFALAMTGAALVLLAGRLRAGRWVRPLGRFLNVAFLLLVAFNGFQVANYASVSAAAAAAVVAPRDVTLHRPGRLPDVYYIILDRYAGSRTLRDVYDFDNEPFLQELEQRGFAVARHAWANYFKTALSLYSSLSMEAIHPDRLGETGPPYDFTSIFAALRGHLAVPSALKSLGYHYLHLGNTWEPTSYNVDADLDLRYQDSAEFTSALLSTTFLSAFSAQAGSEAEADGETVDWRELAWDTTQYTFDELAASREHPGPNFVFAHILLPHPPYVFNADGSFVPAGVSSRRSEKVNYVNQVEYANRAVLGVIDRLLNDPNDPVIVLQADEGPWPARFSHDEVHFNWLKATDAEIAQKFGILNAVHLPKGIDPREFGFTDHTSPVNEFRVVFNAVFGANLPMLPDMTYLSPDYARMYDFVRYPPRG
jgi:hypothetical protein